MYEGTATSSTAGSTTSFGPLHNPQCLPVDLCCGPRAFLSAAPPLASSAEAGCVSEPLDFLPGSDFSKNNIFQGCLSTSALEFNQLQKRLQSLMQGLSDVFSKAVESAMEIETHDAIYHQVVNIDRELESSVVLLGDLKKNVLAQKEMLRRAEHKVKEWTSDVIVQCARYRRRLKRRQALQDLSSQCSLAELLHPRKQPTSANSALVARFPSLCASSLPPRIAELVQEAYLKAFLKGSNQDPCDFLSYVSNLPPSVNGPQPTLEPALAELAFAHHMVQQKNVKFPLIWFNARQARIEKQSNKAWLAYNAAVKQLRRLKDEETSLYRHFPLLRKDQQFRLLNLLGKGGFAEVWQGLRLDTLEIKAIKIIELNPCASAEEQEFVLASTYREVTLQRSLKHPHVVEMQQCFEITPSIFVAVLDLCEGGTLDHYIQFHGPVAEPLARVWSRQILLALEYIHTVGQAVHFDIKPTNILLHDHNVKISDFGLHQPVGAKGTAALDMTEEQNQVGTLWYMPPEHLYAALMLETSVFDARFDIWSAGVVLYEMLYQRRPFGAFANAKGCTYDHVAAVLYTDITKGHLVFDSSTTSVSQQCQAFLRYLLQPIHERPNATAALQHPYMKETACSSNDLIVKD